MKYGRFIHQFNLRLGQTCYHNYFTLQYDYLFLKQTWVQKKLMINRWTNESKGKQPFTKGRVVVFNQLQKRRFSYRFFVRDIFGVCEPKLMILFCWIGYNIYTGTQWWFLIKSTPKNNMFKVIVFRPQIHSIRSFHITK